MLTRRIFIAFNYKTAYGSCFESIAANWYKDTILESDLEKMLELASNHLKESNNGYFTSIYIVSFYLFDKVENEK